LVVVAGALCAIAVGQANGHGGTALPQSAGEAANLLRYEVVSVREVKGDPKAVRLQDLPDGFSMEGLPLESVIPDAYGVDRDRVSGWPGWAAFARFDIEAKMDAETAEALHKLPKQQQDMERQWMMQSLLADRFGLKLHRATEVRTTYELVLAKGGAKLKEDNPSSDKDGVQWQEGVRPSTDWSISDGKISGHAMPISLLADHLQSWVHSTIVDETGLTGRYDVVLQWDPKDEPEPNSTEPSIYVALEEQLGLHLKPTKTQVETIVIDRLEMPSEN
jgi:uncharacterized protein (TIGR03435 family)